MIWWKWLGDKRDSDPEPSVWVATDAVEEAAWAGHSDHLKAVKYDMKRHEEFNLDVNLFFIAVIGLLLAAGYKLISFVTLLIYRRVFVPATKAGKSD